jgi:hypothetical protein
MANTTPAEQASATPRYAKSSELLGVEVEIIFVDEVDGDFGPEYCFDCRKPNGEVVSYTRARDPWRAKGVEAMRQMLEHDEPVMATLVQPGRAMLWKPFDQRGSRMSSGRASRLRQYGFIVATDEPDRPALRVDDRSALRVDDAPPPTDADAPSVDPADVPF